MPVSKKIFTVGAFVVAAAAGAIAVPAVASSGDDTDTDAPISGSELQRASEAALNHLGEGTVTGSEVGDEESYYEIEVTRENGHQVDVQLDKEFNVVTTEDDHGD